MFFLFQVVELALLYGKGKELKKGSRLLRRNIVAEIVTAFSSVPKQDAVESTRVN